MFSFHILSLSLIVSKPLLLPIPITQAQDGSVTGQKIDDNDSAALKKSLEKISTHFNYIKTTPKLNQFEKAQIFAGNGDGFKSEFYDVLFLLEQ